MGQELTCAKTPFFHSCKGFRFQAVACPHFRSRQRLRSSSLSDYLPMTPVAKWLGHFSGFR
jgi:hypothetical protein